MNEWIYWWLDDDDDDDNDYYVNLTNVIIGKYKMIYEIPIFIYMLNYFHLFLKVWMNGFLGWMDGWVDWLDYHITVIERRERWGEVKMLYAICVYV